VRSVAIDVLTGGVETRSDKHDCRQHLKPIHVFSQRATRHNLIGSEKSFLQDFLYFVGLQQRNAMFGFVFCDGFPLAFD
jgi:hypothetical protein